MKNPIDSRWSGWICWAVLFVVVAWLVVDPDHQRSVTGAYRLGPERYWSGEDIYAPGISTPLGMRSPTRPSSSWGSSWEISSGGSWG